jgi:SAM-dependent methyltransferase
MSAMAQHSQAPAEAKEPASNFVGEDLAIDSGSSSQGDDGAVWSSTASLSSSVTSFRMEFGRRYHAFNDDAYWLPNDEEEMSRLELQHVIWSLCLRGRLYIAPLQTTNIERVLDVGTGTGKWAIEFADANPQVQVVGTDLSPIQPEFSPPNCSFVVENVEDEWMFREPFDYIHGRMLMLGIHDWAKYFRQCFEHLKPGGWCGV